MHRRNILAATLASACALFSATRAHAAAPDATKVVYHLDDLDKVDFVLGNIKAALFDLTKSHAHDLIK